MLFILQGRMAQKISMNQIFSLLQCWKFGTILSCGHAIEFYAWSESDSRVLHSCLHLSVQRQSWGRGGGLGGDMVSEGGIPNKTWQGVNKKLIRCQVTWQSGENWPQGLLMKNCGCQKEERISALKNYHLKPQKLLTAWLKIRNCVRLITPRAVWALCCHKRFDPHLPNTPNTIA